MKCNSLIFLLLFTAILSSCDKDTESFEGSDNIIQKERDFSSFDKIIARDDLEINVIMSEIQKVEILVNDNLQEQLITRVDDNTLEILTADGSYTNARFKVNIEMPSLVSVQLNDNTAGVIDFITKDLLLEVDDSSILAIRGSSETLTTNINDDGELQAFSFTTGILNVNSGDASEIEITCNQEINGTVTDAAIVRYKGMPTVNVLTSDEGQIIDAN